MKKKVSIFLILVIFVICTGSKPLNTMTDKKTDSNAASSVTLVMVGDMLMHMPVNRSGLKSDGDIDFSHLFMYTKKMISDADIAIVNQEVILGDKELGISGYPMFNTYYEVGDALVNAGFDVVLHATNHAMDREKKDFLTVLIIGRMNIPILLISESRIPSKNAIAFTS